MRKVLLAFLAGVLFVAGCGRPLTAPACVVVRVGVPVRNVAGDSVGVVFLNQCADDGN